MNRFLGTAIWKPESFEQRGYYGPSLVDQQNEDILDLDAILNGGLLLSSLIALQSHTNHIDQVFIHHLSFQQQ